MTVGDRLARVGNLLVSCMPKETSVGRGAFVTWQYEIRNQRGEAVARVRSTTYSYSPHPDRRPPASARPPGEPLDEGSTEPGPQPEELDWDRQRCWEDLSAGQAVPAVRFPLSVYRLVMAVGANRDFNSIHHNSEWARSSGAPDMYANVLFLQGMWERCARQFIGVDGGILHLSGFRMGSFNTVGDVVTVQGSVARVWADGGTGLAELRMWSQNRHGISVRPGHCDGELATAIRSSGTRPVMAHGRAPSGPSALARALTPASVAIIGAKDSSSTSYGVIEALSRVGFDGRIFAVNRSAAPAHGLIAAASCAAIGEPVDAALLLVPAAAVADVLEDVAEAGIRTAVILSGGWAEAGPEGAARQRTLASRAGELGVTLFGPNCLGFLNVAERTGAWIASVSPDVRPGPVAIVSQSGGVGNALADLAAEFGVGLSCVVTTGNEATVSTSDVLEYLVEDQRTSSIAMFAEAISQPARFLAAAARARELGKAIVILKAGSSALAARNAVTHTGSLVGDDRVVDAALRQCGAVRVRSQEELIVTAGVMAAAGALRAPGIAVVSISGGSVNIVADEADRLGLDLPPFGELAGEEIRAVLPGFAAVQNPLDITGAALGDEFAKVLAIVDRQDAFGAVAVLSNVPSYDSCKVPGVCGLLSTIGTGLGSITLPGFLLSQTIAHLNEPGRDAARDAGVTALPGLSLGIAALARLSSWSRRLQSDARTPITPPRRALGRWGISRRSGRAASSRSGGPASFSNRRGCRSSLPRWPIRAARRPPLPRLSPARSR